MPRHQRVFSTRLEQPPGSDTADSGTGAGNPGTWYQWIGQYRTAGNNPTITLHTTTSHYATQTWTLWNQASATTNNYGPFLNWQPHGIFHVPEPETELDRAWREALSEDAVYEARRRQWERAEADLRAEALLVANLDATQRKDFLSKGEFYLHIGDRRYRIRRGWSGNVELLDKDGKVKHRYCAHPSEFVPHCDNMLAQKLYLETNEEGFLRVANRS